MNREQTAELLKTYKTFPESEVFTLRPINYPLFHLMECFAKGWSIHYLHSWGGMDEIEDINFEALALELKREKFPNIWQYVARDPNRDRYTTTLGFVQADLYARYVGKCNPLKTPNTSWIFIPKNMVVKKEFNGKIGNHTQLYQIEINLETTDIVGKIDGKLPWHYLQQTIDWKPWMGRIDWQERDGDNIAEPGNETLRERFNRVRAERFNRAIVTT